VPREGVLIRNPYERMTKEQLSQIHNASITILNEPGLISFNREAIEILGDNGAIVTPVSNEGNPSWHVKIPEKLVMKALESAPKTVVLGARDKENTLILKGDEPRVHLVTGSECNIWLDVDFHAYTKKSDSSVEVMIPEFRPRRGTITDLCQAAKVFEHLDTVDAFIRCVNIQDKDVTEDNKDVNKYFASLNNTTKHFMSGLTNLEQLDNVVNMAEIIAGGEKELKENPIISFITCLVKSPLQFVEDTTQTLIEICRRGLPIVVSSSPQAGTTAPPAEHGILAQINAEVLAGITLGQLVNKGTPMLYGTVPVKARLDNLNDSYGSPETSQYNVDCVQLARFYNLPNYSTAGVCDVKTPGTQSSIERLFSDIMVTLSGPQYLHCAFGLLDGNSTFCLLQAVLDDEHFQRIKFFLRPLEISQADIDETHKQIGEVVATEQKLYISYIRRMMRSGRLSMPYPFEGDGEKDNAMYLAYEKMRELTSQPVEHIDPDKKKSIFNKIPGILPRLSVDE
jgi:trimethylamine--corrinoid protein Co-methyltransferase